MNGSPHRQSVARRFSAAAGTYDAHARVQREVIGALLDVAPDLPNEARILDAGCGTGLLTQRVLERYPSAQIDAFDASPHMVERARKRLGPAAPVTWLSNSFEGFRADSTYDLVVTSAALHWVPSLASAVQSLARCVKPQGHLLAALMVEGTLSELMAARARVAPYKRTRATLPSAETAEQAFAASALEGLSCRNQRFSEHHPSARAFLDALHAAGLTGGVGSGSAPPLVRGELKRLEADYETHYRDARGVRATYEVLFVRGRGGDASGRNA